ncbi:MAG TPA: tetratricopeptide repeat protein [Chloroflexota bacterium]|nr:tetratricopeptide repeat protein [Chloroflexota bacterium]
MASLFISYRRDDTRHVAGRLRDSLISHFGDEQVFRDVDSLHGGYTWDTSLEEQVGSCDIVLVLIGSMWLTVTGRDGKRRLDDARDWVRREIVAALQRGIPIFPVLVDDAPPPPKDDLPRALQPLTRWQMFNLRDDRWHDDVHRLIRDIEAVLERSRQESEHRTESARESVALETPVPRQILPVGGFLGSIPSDKLVGREDELTRVLQSVDAATQEGRLVLLAGEPGAGKTRLAQEATVGLHNRGFLIAAGRCYEPQQAVPYFPFIDALAALFAVAPAALRRDAATLFPWLGQLLPDEIGGRPAGATGGTDDQQRLFRAVTGFLTALAASVPVAILLDDLHWADQASLDLLGHLARHTRHAPILTLGTYRDVEVRRRHPLEGTLRGLHRDGLVERIDVRRLDQAGTAALIAASFGEAGISDDFASLVHRHTEGNPFFTREVLQTLIDRGDVFQHDGIWERKEVAELEVPESIRSALDERVARLDDTTQEILGEASVLGQSFTFDDLETMSGRGESAIEAGLEEAIEAGLVRESGRDRYAFNHALTHQALYAELSARKRRRLHRAAGEALEQLPERKRAERTVELARHFLEADEPEKALRYSLDAGERAEAVFAHAEAERHYREALALAQDIGNERAEAETGEKLGRVLSGTARYDEAMRCLDTAARTYRRIGDLAATGRVTAAIGRLYRWQGDPEAGIARVQSMIDELGARAPSDALGALYIALAHLFFLSGRYNDVVAVAERASEIAADDPATLAEARERQGTALIMLDQPGEGKRILEEILPVVEAGENLPLLQRMIQNIGCAADLMGDGTTATRCFHRAVELAEQVGNPDQLAFTLANLGTVLMNGGEWIEARSYIDRAAELARSNMTSNASFPIKLQGSLALRQGDWEKARSSLSESLRLAEETGNRQAHEQALAALSLLDILEGHPQEAVERLAPLADQEGVDVQILESLAHALLDTGNLDQAAELAERAAERARSGDELSLPDTLMVQGLVKARQGRLGEAELLFRDVLDLARALPSPYVEACALYELGIITGQSGDRDGAREMLEQSLVIFRKLGARKDVEEAEEALRSQAGNGQTIGSGNARDTRSAH